MLVIFPVYTSYESQIVLHWQKSLLCWRDSLDLNQVINKCFSTQVNASHFIMSFTLCLPENPNCFMLVTDSTWNLILWWVKASTGEKRSSYFPSASSVVTRPCRERAQTPRNSSRLPYVWVCFLAYFFCFIFPLPVLLPTNEISVQRETLCMTCNTHENKSCAWWFMRRHESS